MTDEKAAQPMENGEEQGQPKEKFHLDLLVRHAQDERHLISKLGRVLMSHARHVQPYIIYGFISFKARGQKVLETKVPSRRRLVYQRARFTTNRPDSASYLDILTEYKITLYEARGSSAPPPVFPLGLSSPAAPTARQNLVRCRPRSKADKDTAYNMAS